MDRNRIAQNSIVITSAAVSPELLLCLPLVAAVGSSVIVLILLQKTGLNF